MFLIVVHGFQMFLFYYVYLFGVGDTLAYHGPNAEVRRQPTGATTLDLAQVSSPAVLSIVFVFFCFFETGFFCVA